MKILCLIPAKKYSRLSNKNFLILKRKLSRMDNHLAKKIKLFNEIIVSSDDTKFQAAKNSKFFLKKTKKILKRILAWKM